MAYQKKENTVMTRVKASDHAIVKAIADDQGISIPDKLSEIIRQWLVDHPPVGTVTDTGTVIFRS